MIPLSLPHTAVGVDIYFSVSVSQMPGMVDEGRGDDGPGDDAGLDQRSVAALAEIEASQSQSLCACEFPCRQYNLASAPALTCLILRDLLAGRAISSI